MGEEKIKYFGNGDKSCSSNKPELMGVGTAKKNMWFDKGDPEDKMYGGTKHNRKHYPVSMLLCTGIEASKIQRREAKFRS